MNPSPHLNDSTNQLKKQIFEHYLPTNVLVYIADLNACRGIPPEVFTPGQLLALDYGLSMPNPISNFKVDDDGIYATLSFNQTPTATFVPWFAVVSIFNTATQFGCCWPTPDMRLFLLAEPIDGHTQDSNLPAPKPKLSVVR